MIILAADHGGYLYKEKLKEYFNKNNIVYRDFGTDSKTRCDAIDFCVPASKEVAKNKTNRGIFICKSGQAMEIIANKQKGVRAVVCFDAKQAVSAREHNDCNVLALGSGFVSFSKAKKIIEKFLSTDFLKVVPYTTRIEKLNKLEKLG